MSAAAGHTFGSLNGYLATITSAAEQSFLNTLNPNNTTAWLGGSDDVTEGQWQWETGPETGQAFTYTNWAAFEPNNCCGGEDGLLGWWSGTGWNDIYDGQGNYAYVVEYNASISAVPLPATLPMLFLGIAGLGFWRRRKA